MKLFLLLLSRRQGSMCRDQGERQEVKDDTSHRAEMAPVLDTPPHLVPDRARGEGEKCPQKPIHHKNSQKSTCKISMLDIKVANAIGCQVPLGEEGRPPFFAPVRRVSRTRNRTLQIITSVHRVSHTRHRTSHVRHRTSHVRHRTSHVRQRPLQGRYRGTVVKV